ncbi:MAG: exosortase [Magnetococcus sp. WYHC-3]
MTGKDMDRARWLCFALAALALTVLFWPAMRFSVAMFSDPHEDLSHGWLVPLVSAYVIWEARARLRAAAAAPDWRGLFVLLGCLLLFWLGSRGEQARLMQFGMIGCVVALPFVFWGSGVARRLFFAAAYLCLIIPTSFLDVLTFRLRLLAAWVASGVLNGVGIAVQQMGTAMISTQGAGFKLDVADPCSGMRSVFALAALTAAYAYFTQATALRRWLLFACAVPLAVIGNIVRIVSIGLVAFFLGQERAVGFYHDYSGYVVFVVAVLLMMQAGVWIAKIGRTPVPTKEPSARAFAGDEAQRLRTLAPCFLALLMAIGCQTAIWLSPPLEMEPDNFMAAEQPAQVGAFRGQTPWFCQNDQCLASFGEDELAVNAVQANPACLRCGQPLARLSLGEKTWLPADTRILKCNYSRDDGNLLAMTVVVSGKSRLSIHRPEMCLPGQGFQILSSQVRVLDLGQGRTLRVKAVQAARTGERPIGFLYWFVNSRSETTSHWVRIFSDVWARSVHNRINRWSMVTVFSNHSIDDPEMLRTTEQFLAEWYPQMLAACR